MGEIKEKVLRTIKLLPTFVEIDKAKYRVGQAIVDPVTGEAYRSVGNKFKLITNDMLLEFIAQHHEIRTKTFYVNDLGDSTYINGIFREYYSVHKEDVIYLGFTVANSYSLRFPPKIFLNFYIERLKLFIKTNIELVKLSKTRDLDEASLLQISKNHIEGYLSTKQEPKQINQVLQNLTKNLPNKYKNQVIKIADFYAEEYDINSLHYICIVTNTVCNMWSKTSYEVADSYARKIFNTLNLKGAEL